MTLQGKATTNRCLIPRQINCASARRRHKCAALLGCAKAQRRLRRTHHRRLLAGAPHPYRRRFVRDGEVPVTLVHREHDDGAGINRIDAARQALREQVAAREQAEHLLQEARTTIQTLETKLAHERIGRDEALRRLEDELAAERTTRQQAEEDRDKAITARQDAEERLREATLRARLETKGDSQPAGTASRLTHRTVGAGSADRQPG